jgi:DNA-binding NarL/FixJ family response regulator
MVSSSLSSNRRDRGRLVADLLVSELPKTDVCLLLDVYMPMPEMNGVQLYQKLAVARHDLPVIMMHSRCRALWSKTLEYFTALGASELIPGTSGFHYPSS